MIASPTQPVESTGTQIIDEKWRWLLAGNDGGKQNGSQNADDVGEPEIRDLQAEKSSGRKGKQTVSCRNGYPLRFRKCDKNVEKR